MSYVMAAPETMAAAATDLAAVGSTLSAAHMAAGAPTAAVIPAAADEVSANIAHLFSQHAQDYQTLAGQAAVFHEQFVHHLNAGAGAYTAAEVTNAASLQVLGANAGSSANAIAAVSEPLTSVNAALGQSLNTFTIQLIAFLHALYVSAYLVYISAFLLQSSYYLLTGLFGPLYLFGAIPLPR
jgi:hypothetical protein